MTSYVPIYTSIADVQSKTGLTDTEVPLSTSDTNVRMTIEDAEVEVELLTGRKFTNGNSFTEYLSARQADIIGTFSSYIQLNKFPIQSITTFQTLDLSDTILSDFAALTSGNISAGIYDTVDYWLEINNDTITNTQAPTGMIRLKTQSFPEGQNNIKIVYTYGYSTVPVPIRNLATCLAGIRLWTIFLGGSYNRLNSYQIPQQSVNKGDFYQRGKQMIEQLTDEADRILSRVGKKPRTMFGSTGAPR